MYTKAHTTSATLAATEDSAKRTGSRSSTDRTYSATAPPREKSSPMANRSMARATKRVTAPAYVPSRLPLRTEPR